MMSVFLVRGIKWFEFQNKNPFFFVVFEIKSTFKLCLKQFDYTQHSSKAYLNSHYIFGFYIGYQIEIY